jgi:pantoate--beta-alanine ligase
LYNTFLYSVYIYLFCPLNYRRVDLVKKIADLKTIVNRKRSDGSIIGFVPTMGALHQGHISLVEKAGEVSDFVIVSIFVNPTQFNNREDLDRYPRVLDTDLTLLENTACNLVFAPEVDEMYPEPDTRSFHFGYIEQVMEGKFRPGHFNGVAQVVSKLFDAVNPDKAFFGLKDYQQLAIINQLVASYKYPVEIVPCPIIREPDGLAMSSRNMLLEPEQRHNASLISKTLFEATNKVSEMNVDELKKWVLETINANPFFETEYFEIVDFNTMEPINNWGQKVNKIACIAVHCGKVRLIDNVIL